MCKNNDLSEVSRLVQIVVNRFGGEMRDLKILNENSISFSWEGVHYKIADEVVYAGGGRKQTSLSDRARMMRKVLFPEGFWRQKD